MTIERIEIDPATPEGRKHWLSLRGRDITASVVGALFGAHPYVSALKLYLLHSGVEFPEHEESSVLKRGRLLESAVAAAVADQRPDWTIIKNKHYYRDPELRLGGTPDFLVEDENLRLGVLQTKTCAPNIFERDWDSGKTIPFWITLQCLTEMLVTNADFGVVAPLRVDAFNLECPILEVERHPASEQKIMAAVKQFWDDVQHGREPEPDYGKDAALLAILAPRAAKDKAIDLSGDNEIGSLLDQREQLKDSIKHCSKRCEEIETEIKFKLRDAERAIVPGWSITWKNQHTEEHIVKARDTRVLRIFDKRDT